MGNDNSGVKIFSATEIKDGTDIKYLGSISGKRFRSVNDEQQKGDLYRLYNRNGDFAEFDFYCNNEKTIKRTLSDKGSYFSEKCIIKGDETLECIFCTAGRVMLVDNCWEVVEPTIIEFVSEKELSNRDLEQLKEKQETIKKLANILVSLKEQKSKEVSKNNNYEETIKKIEITNNNLREKLLEISVSDTKKPKSVNKEPLQKIEFVEVEKTNNTKLNNSYENLPNNEDNIEQYGKKESNSFKVAFWIVLITLIVCALFIANNSSKYNELNYAYNKVYNEYLDEKNKINDLEKKHSKSVQEYIEKYSQLEQDYSQLEKKYSQLSSKYPVIIDSIKVGNWNNDNWINKPGQKLVASQIRYLSPAIYYQEFGNISSKTFYLKIIDPNGHVDRNSEISPKGYTLSKKGGLDIGGWGNESGGSYWRGTWRIEIWMDGMKIGEKSIYLN